MSDDSFWIGGDGKPLEYWRRAALCIIIGITIVLNAPTIIRLYIFVKDRRSNVTRTIV